MRNTSLVAIAFAAATLTGGLAATAQAATVLPTVVGFSSQFGGYEAVYATDAFELTDWASNSQGVGSFIDLDLGASYTLSGAEVTDRVTSGGANNTSSFGITDFTTQFRLTFFNSDFSVAGASFTFSKPTPVGPTSVADFAYSAGLPNVTGQYVRYTVLAANGPNPGLSNISFNAVPEPATWALMIGGFGLAGVALRRRTGVAA